MIKEKKEKDTQKESYIWIIPIGIIGGIFLIMLIFSLYYYFKARMSYKASSFENSGKINKNNFRSLRQAFIDRPYKMDIEREMGIPVEVLAQGNDTIEEYEDFMVDSENFKPSPSRSYGRSIGRRY